MPSPVVDWCVIGKSHSSDFENASHNLDTRMETKQKNMKHLVFLKWMQSLPFCCPQGLLKWRGGGSKQFIILFSFFPRKSSYCTTNNAGERVWIFFLGKFNMSRMGHFQLKILVHITETYRWEIWLPSTLNVHICLYRFLSLQQARKHSARKWKN